MIDPLKLYTLFQGLGFSFFTGVPDSTLSNFTDVLVTELGTHGQHIVAPNEGGAVALACGHYLATEKPALVYMQNSGIGNAVNPIVSLSSPDVYNIPVLYCIGWRGEPGVHDEPQHLNQGKITLELLDTLCIDYMIVGENTECTDIESQLRNVFMPALAAGRSVAFIFKKGSFTRQLKLKSDNIYPLTREEAICHIVNHCGDKDVVVSTTGKTSRELFEYRESKDSGHHQDFLTVGSMGHASLLALAIAQTRKSAKVWCIDGDGAVLMHMGALALVGNLVPRNYIHVIINNNIHESVGGTPTISKTIDYTMLAKSCGYPKAICATNAEQLQDALKTANDEGGPVLLEIRTNGLSRKDLGRPTTTPLQNRDEFMRFLRS